MAFFTRVLAIVSLSMASITYGCSKENNVSLGASGTGEECQATEDCGPGAVCTLGICRVGCTNDAECPQGTLCVGDRPPYGCTTLDEGACSSANPCPTGLTCGIDGRCRNACAESIDCPRNEQDCVAGTCVSHSEPDAEETWFACKEGEEACVTSEEVYRQPLAEAIALATGSDADIATCAMPGCESGDPSCQRNVYTPSLGGYSDSVLAGVHLLCNVTGPGWRVLEDCGSWAYCVTALSASNFGQAGGDYICSSAAEPPLKSEYCGPWYGEPECEEQFLAGSDEPLCRDGLLGDCRAPHWRAYDPQQVCSMP